MSLDKVSIITPSLNRADMLESAIQSVMLQGYPDYEHIIVDGGSTDGTLELIRKYSHMRLICEADRGMYDALNKGLKVAAGEIVGFLNTDDVYAEDVFFAVAERFQDRDVMAVAGEAVVFSEPKDGNTIIISKYSPQDVSLLESSTLGRNHFNAWFFRRSVFDVLGPFDVMYQVAGDRDFMLRFCLSDLKYVATNKLVYRYRQHGGSLTFDDSDNKREVSAKDHLTMTGIYLKNRKLPSAARKLLIQLRTRETLEMATRSRRSRNLKKYFYYLGQSIRYDAAWIVQGLWQVLLRKITLGVRFARRILERIGSE